MPSPSTYAAPGRAHVYSHMYLRILVEGSVAFLVGASLLHRNNYLQLSSPLLVFSFLVLFVGAAADPRQRIAENMLYGTVRITGLILSLVTIPAFDRHDPVFVICTACMTGFVLVWTVLTLRGDTAQDTGSSTPIATME